MKRIVSPDWPTKTGKLARLRELLEWYWFVWILPISKRFLAILAGIGSALVVLGEFSLFLDTPVGLVPIFFEKNHGYFATEVFCFFCLSFIIYCTFIALFRLKLKGRYGLYKDNHTDPPNLVWSAQIMARMTPSLCFNFLMYIKVTGTQFEKVLGIIDLVPILGKQFAVFFPMILVVFVLLNVFNVYSRLMAKIGIPQFGFGDMFEDEDKVVEGKRLIANTRGRVIRESYASVATNPVVREQSHRSIYNNLKNSLL